MNVDKATDEKILNNAEIASIILEIGANYGDDFDIKKIKYNKIIIAADADIDGAHIRSLLLTLFYRLMPQLIIDGHLYICVTPLFKINYGSSFDYAYSDKELNDIKKKNKSKIKTISRFKGLGEQAVEEIHETALCPKTRKLKQITLDDIKQAEDMTKIYMGTKVDKRKENIMSLATDESIDIDY